MIHLWKAGAVVLAAKVAVGWVAYVLNGSIPAAIFAGICVALFLFLAATFDEKSFGAEGAAALRAAAFTGIFAGCAVLFTLAAMTGTQASFGGRALICGIALVCIVYTIALTAAAAKKTMAQSDDDEEDESGFPSFFVMASPLGIGTLIGGSLLLLRRFRESGDNSNWLRD